EIELFSDSIIRNISYPIRKPRRAFYVRFCSCRLRTQEAFGQWLGNERARSNSRLEITFRMKPRKSDVYRETRYAKAGGQVARRGDESRFVVEACRKQFIPNLAIKLFMKRFIRSAIELNHFKSHDRMAPLLNELFRRSPFHVSNRAH